MEVNKDEAVRCIDLAQKYIKERNREKAEKFLHKAERLYPTAQAKELLLKIQLMAPSAETEKIEQPRKRNSNLKAEESSGGPTWTPEHAEAVKRIQKCKDYYEILMVSKDATDTEIKRSYKKLALLLHPDKNTYPGAAEAFKAIGNAVAVLTDIEKRKQYDMFGADEGRLNNSGHRTSHTYSRGFESDATAEELFNMFFGGGFANSNVYVRRNGRWQRQGATTSETNTHREQQQSSYTALIQLLPILLAILLSMASGLFISDPAYSLQSSAKYPVQRITQNLRVPYYVKENFHTEYQGSVRRLEVSVEEDYLSNLRHACYREKNYRDSMMWKARSFGDKEMFQNAQSIKTPSCDELQRLRSHG